MKRATLKIKLIYLILILYLVFAEIIFINKIAASYNLIINPIFWLLISSLTYLLCKEDKSRVKNQSDKLQNIFIVILFYLMIWFVLGLLVGYTRSGYSHTIVGIIKNLWSFFIIIIFQEYVRDILIQYSRGKTRIFILVTILFSLFEVNFFGFGRNFASGESGFKYCASILFPILTKNVICTYIVSVASFKGSCFYRMPIMLANLLLPFYPNYDWFMLALAGSLLPLVMYYAVSSAHEKKDRRNFRRGKKEKVVKNLPFYIIFFIIICFIAGFFKYAPVAVVSKSMHPLIKRGDVVIVDKLKKEEIEKLKINDIIEYRLEGFTVVHRIVDKENKNGEIIFTTKGDNNKIADAEKVKVSQVVGSVKYKIPVIGFPSVWLNDFLKKSKPNVET